MTKKETATSKLHRIPAYLRKVINSTRTVRVAWEDITPLARIVN